MVRKRQRRLLCLCWPSCFLSSRTWSTSRSTSSHLSPAGHRRRSRTRWRTKVALRTSRVSTSSPLLSPSFRGKSTSGCAPRLSRSSPATLESFNPFPDSVLSALFHLDHLWSHSERVSAFSPSLGNLTTAPSITPHACTLAATAPGPRDRPPGTRRNHPQRRGPSIIRAFHDSPIPQFRWFEIGRTGERVTLEVDLVRPLRGGEEGGAVRLVLLCVAGICRECA